MIHAERRDMGTFTASIQERGGGGETDAAFSPVYRLVHSGARFGTLTARLGPGEKAWQSAPMLAGPTSPGAADGGKIPREFRQCGRGESGAMAGGNRKARPLRYSGIVVAE